MDAVSGIVRFMAMGKVVQNSSRVHARVDGGKNLAYCSTHNSILHNIFKYQFDGGLGSADISDLVMEGKILKICSSRRLRGP